MEAPNLVVVPSTDITVLEELSTRVHAPPSSIVRNSTQSDNVPQRVVSENEYDILLGHTRLCFNSVQILQRAQRFGNSKSEMDIPLCRMLSMQVVRPALASDIEKMKVDFVHGYQPRTAVLYVLTHDFHRKEHEVVDSNRMTWSAHWCRRNVEFEEFLQREPVLHNL